MKTVENLRLAKHFAEEPGRSPALARALISSFLGSASVREILKRTMNEGRKTVGELISAGQERGQDQAESQEAENRDAISSISYENSSYLVAPRNPVVNIWIEDSFERFLAVNFPVRWESRSDEMRFIQYCPDVQVRDSQRKQPGNVPCPAAAHV